MKALAFAFGLTVFGIGFSTLTGYLFGLTGLYRWDEGIGMAINTGVALVFAGSAICILSSRPLSFSDCKQQKPLDEKSTQV